MKHFRPKSVTFLIRWTAAACLATVMLIGVPLAAVAEQDLSATKQEIVQLIVNYHVSGVDEDDLDLHSIDTIITSLQDPYTQYFSTEEWEAFMNSLENNYTGIGVRIGQDDYGVYVDEVFPSTPAAKAGLFSGDYIVEVEGKSAAGKTTTELVNEITGIEGTNVTLTVEREKQRIEFTITRQAIHISAITSRYMNPGIGYIRISSFSSDADELFSEEVDALLEEGMNTLILDLRDNPGGLLDTAGNMASKILGKGNLIHTRDRSQTETPYPIRDNQPLNVPILVLVNEQSASASEVLAGALQDYQAATLIGLNTYGKGSVQSLYELTDGSVLKLTVQEYLTPLKHPVNKVGLKPDVEVYGGASQLITALQQAAELDLQLEMNSRGITINGVSFTDSFKVLRENGLTYVPSRILAAMIEGDVNWDSNSRSVVVHSGDQTSQYPVNSEGVLLRNGVSYIALNRFQTDFDSLLWSDRDGLLTMVENGR
jgi:carboxyl-terminal processing protease